MPWSEDQAGFDGYGSNLQAKWQLHRSKTDANPDHLVYLGLTPLDDSRSGLADYWAEREHQPLPDRFAAAAFDAEHVVDAYRNYVLSAVDWYQPDYLAIGVEVNLLAKNDPASWPALVSLLGQTYAAVKAQHPDLPVFVTVTAPDLLAGWTDTDHDAQLSALDDVLRASDYLALSFYPYASKYLTGPVPDDAFDKLAALAGGRPMAIAETGYPAELTEMPSYGLTFEGTPDKQRQWIETVLGAAETNGMEFVVNFVGRDYDALWRSIGEPDLAAAWRDTGLFSEDGTSRPALESWSRYLAMPRAADR